MQRIFLLRAYGDFVIALQAIAKSDKKIQIVASDHLAPLYHTMVAAAVLPPLSIQFIALGIQHGQLNFFTNKHLLSWDTWQQLSLLKAYIKANPNQEGIDYIEQDIRRSVFNFIIGHDFQAVVPADANVYNAYSHWLGLSVANNISNKIDNASVLIFPDARLKKKAIIPAHIQRIVKSESNQYKQIKIARFNNTNKAELSYSNFEELISLIQDAGFIYTADSLPAHLAALVKIPHTIVYSFNGVNRFCTPYAFNNKSYIIVND
ncbi:MAG: hypothetical protein RL387_1716 [Bacteroidota bacterium]|jgi:hypothetical protein